MSADRQHERLIVFISCLGHALCHMGELIFAGVLLALTDEFQLDNTTATALALLGYMLMGFGALPMGAWADAWGATRVMHIYFVLLAAASLAVIASTEPWHLFATLTMLGIVLSIYHPTGLTMISLGVKKRGRAMGINGVAGSIGQAFGPTLGMLCAWMGWWRLAYVVLAVLSLIAAGVMVWAQRQIAALQRPEQVIEHAPSPPMNRRVFWGLALLLLAMVMGGFNYRCLATALPGFFGGEVDKTSPFKGGPEVFCVILIGGIMGQLLGGWAADRFGARCYSAFISLLLPLAVLLAFSEGTLAAAVPVAGLLAVFLFAQQPIENLLLAEWSDRRRYSFSYGAKFALTFGVGAVGTVVTGAVWDASGTPGPVFYLVAGSAGVMFLFSLAARAKLRQESLARAAAKLEAELATLG